MDVGWRRRTVGALALHQGATVLDLACGTGDLCRDLEVAGLRPIGVDLSFGMLRRARTDAPLVHGDVLRLPLRDASVDGASCGLSLRNLVDIPGFLHEVARVVRPGGRIAILEVAEPPNRLLRFGHRVYFRGVVPRIGALLSNADAYRYLPRSVAYLPPPERLGAMLLAAGFRDVVRTLLSAGISQLITGTREPSGPGALRPSCTSRRRP